jgi:hypothetical protein
LSQLGAMLTLETARIFNRKKTVPQVLAIDIQIINPVHESGNFQTTPFQKKPESSPKNRISWAPWAQFEKSDFSQKIGFLGRLGTV